MNFDKDFSIMGQWWIPGKENKHYGELTYKENNGFFLRINDAFTGVADLMEHSGLSFPVIYGMDKNRNFYTLLNARGETFGKMEFFQSQFEIEIVLRNHQRHHYDSKKLKIKEIRFSTNLFLSFF